MAIHDGEQILPTNAFEGFADENEDKSLSDLPGADIDDSPEDTIAKTRPPESNDLDDDDGGLNATSVDDNVAQDSEAVPGSSDTEHQDDAAPAAATPVEPTDTGEDDEDFIPLIEDEDTPPLAANAEQPKISKKEKFERYSRSVQKRINKEVKQREALRAQNEALRQEVEQIKQSMQKDKANEELAIIDNRLRNATAIKQNYMEEGEYKQAAEVDNDIIEMRIKRERIIAQPAQQAPQAPPAQHGYPPEHYPNQAQQPPAGGYVHPGTAQAPAPNVPADVPTVQTTWITGNPRFGREAGYTAYVNEVYDGMVEQGYNPADPNMYAELDRRIGRSTSTAQTPGASPAAPTGQPAPAPRAPAAPPPNSGRQAPTGTKSKGLTEADKVNMRGWNLDPNNVEHRKEWLRNKS